jgi:hypothetical protein
MSRGRGESLLDFFWLAEFSNIARYFFLPLFLSLLYKIADNYSFSFSSKFMDELLFKALPLLLLLFSALPLVGLIY